jgi:vacuolar protein sorting-associated protein 13B
MAKHYLSGALVRAGWVVGSLEILGNPGGFARTVGSGVKDFVQLPYEGIIHGPWAFITGVTHGSLSLVKHFTAGEFMIKGSF